MQTRVPGALPQGRAPFLPNHLTTSTRMKTKLGLVLLCGGFLAGVATCLWRQPVRNQYFEIESRDQPWSRGVASPDPLPAKQPEPPAAVQTEIPPLVGAGVASSQIAGGASSPTSEVPLATATARQTWLEAWKTHAMDLAAKCGDSRVASTQLMNELDEASFASLLPTLDQLAEQTPAERAERLSEIKAELHQRAGEVLGLLWPNETLGNAPVLPASLEAIAAEEQYAEMASGHEQRVAFLRLDQERETRISNIFASCGFGPEAEQRVRDEIDPWYEGQLGRILGTTQTR